ncbi:OmpA family protein [Pseudofrankia asymbiotica]|nr:OmpA family protein [Pseudofrankia asymbiotica]
MPDGADPFAALADEATVARATDLARAGQHARAQTLLDDLGARRAHTAPEHDLLARIHAQQGRLTAAAEHWRRAAELGGHEAVAVAGLRRIAALEGRHVTTRGRAAVAVLAAVALLGAGAVTGWAITDATASDPDTNTTVNVAPRALSGPASPGTAPTGPGTPTETAAASAGPSARPAASPLQTLADQVAGPEVTATRAGGQVVLLFNGQLFTGGAALSPDGAAALAGVGARIAGLPGVAVEIVGHSDDLPVPPGGPYADNTALSQARAAAAATVLTGAGLSPAQITVSAAGSAVPLHPNTPADRARNRTVTLRLTPPS